MIVRSNPREGLDSAEMASFDSDAQDNRDAIREIDAEASRHGLVRTREYWLPTFALPDGRVVRRGFCYRPAPSDVPRRTAERRGTRIAGIPSQELIRAGREA